MKDNKNVLITGASSGLGKAVLAKLNKLGNCNFALVARNKEKLMRSIAEDIFSYNDICSLYIKDLKDELQISELIQAINEPLDTIVLAAGELKYMPIAFLKKTELTDVLNINFISPVLLVQGLLKAKKIKRGASIVFVSSISSHVGVIGTLAYASSKAALEAAVRVLAAELASKKIKVNAVCPGLINTPMLKEASILNGVDIISQNSLNYPLGIGEPQDVAAFIAFLVSEENNWITGQSLIIDGGYILNK